MEYFLSPEEEKERQELFKPQQRVAQPYIQGPQLAQRYHETLDSLENDPQYIERAERFLRGLSEDDTMVDDLYEYFRDADYNIARGVNRAFKTLPNLSDQQKEDYAYLRDRFENADTGSLKQYLTATRDIGLDIASDPTAWIGALLVPWTGGGSMVTRQAMAQTVKMGLKRVGKSFLHDKPMLGVVKKQKIVEMLPKGGIDWKKTMALGKQARTKAIQAYYKTNVKQMGKLGASEGAFFTGMDDWLRQERDDIDGIKLREGLDYFSIGTSTAIGAGFGWLLGAGLTKAGQKISVNTQNNLRRFSDERQLNDSDFIYKAKQVKDTIISNTIGKPATRFLTLAEYSPTLTRLLENLRYDTFKGYEKRFLGESYGQRLTDLQGKYQVMYEDAVKPFMREGKAWWQTDGLVKEDQDILLQLMRTKPINWAESVPKATDVHKNSARAIRRLTYQVLLDSRAAGIYRSPLRRGPNDWMPRRYKWSVLDQDRDEFAQILVDEDAITLPDNIVADYLSIEDLSKYQVLENKIKNFTDVIGSKDEVAGEGWSSKELADLRNPGNLFKVYNDIQKEMTEILEKGTKNQAGLNVEKLRAANRIVDDMLDKKHLVHEIDAETTGTMGPSSFSPRSLWMINDESIAKFIDDDFNTLLMDYFGQSARLIARKEKLGVSPEEFKVRFIEPIRDELKENGKVLTARDTKALLRTYKYAAGLDDQLTGGLGTLSDAIKLSQQVAHLPLATISSLTEIMIPLTRVNLSTYGKGMAQAIKHASKKVHHDSIEQLQTVHGLSTEEAYREMHRFYLGLEQAVAQRIDSLAGEGLQSPLMRKWQNVFFKTNLLSQWTRTVQLAAFTMGKDQIARNLRVMRRLETPSIKKKGLTKAETRSKNMAEQELLDLGINITEGKRWVARGEKFYSTVKDVRTNLLFWDSYYENEVMKGAARFANEVILDPSKSAVTRPNMQQSRAGTIFFQFLGYPTAFTNTVLKNYVNDVKRNPVVGTSKVLATSLGMTMVSAGFNALRSGGESLDKEPYEVVRDSVQRWGGLGYFEYIENLRRNVDIGGGLLGSSVKAIGGPAVGDVVDALLYRKGLGEIVATNIPGYSALSLMPSVKAKVKGFGKDIDYRSAVGLGLREPKEEVSPYTEHRRKYREQRKPYQEFRQDRYFEGGKIDLPVAQTKINPSSRIDRMTGLPYDEQAGDILKNREGFAVGSIVTRGLTRGLSKYARQLFKGDDIVNDALFSKLKPVLKMIGSEEPALSQPYTQSGHQRGVPQSELDLRKEGFLADSITDKVYYVMEDVGEEGADLVQSTQWGRPTIGIRASTRPEAIERGRELYRQGKQNLRMSRGHLRTRSPLNYEGDAPSETFSLLYDDDFLNLLRVEEQKLLGIKPKFDKRLSKETKKGLREEITIGGRGELIAPTYTETWQRELGEVGPNIKRLESLKKDYEKTIGTIDKLDFANSDFDADSIREGVLGFYTRSMHDILKDMGYDSIIYHGSPRARPKLIPIKTEPHTAKIERLITAQHRKEGGIDSDLYGELDYREVGGYRSVATEGEEPIDIAADVEDLMTATGTTEEELKKQGLTEFDPETIYDLEREAIDAEQRIYDSDVTTYRFEPEYKGVTKDIYPTEQTLSQEYKDNPTYIIFDSEQWMPFGTWEIPTTKEIADTNNLSIGNKIDFIKENTVLNTPTRVLERVLDNDRPLNIIRMGDNNEPIGIMHSFEEITPESLNSLRQRLDFRNPDQREAYKRLMDRYREYRGNEPGVRGIPGEGRVAASIDPIIPEESIYSHQRQLDSELYSDDPLGRRMSTRKGSNLKPIDRDIESLQDYSDEELAALRRESERAEGALSVSFRNKRYDQNELDSIQQDIGELNVDRKGGFNNEFDEKVVPSIRDDEWFKSAQAMGRSEEELRRGEPVYMRIDTISGNDKQVLVTNERNEVPLITARGMINRIKGGKNSIYLHHPKDNNPLTDIARSWSILNRDHPDIVKTYDLTRIPKGTTETLGKRLERLEKERVRIVNFNRHQKQEIAEIITDKGKTKGPSKSEIEEADVIMWIPITKKDEPKFLRHLIKDIPDGYVKSTIYRGWLEPEGFNHAAYPDVGDIHVQMTKVTPDRDVDTKDIIKGTGDIKAWEALAKQLEDNFVEEKMAVLKIGEPQSEIKRKELGYRPLSTPTEDQIQRKMAGRSEASAYSIVPRLTGILPSGEESWTNVNYAREFIDFLKSDAVVIRERTPTRLSSALEKWSEMAPSTLRMAEDILQGRKVRPQKGKAFNPVIDEATGKRILQGEVGRGRQRKGFGGYLKKAFDEASIAQPGFRENTAYDILNFDQWQQQGFKEQDNNIRISKAEGGYEPPPSELIAEALEKSPPITSFLRELNIKYANEVPPVEPYPEMTYAEQDIPPITEQQVRDLVTKSEGVITPEFSAELQRRLPESWRFTGEHGIFAKLGVELPGFQGRKSRSILYGLPEEGEDQPSTRSFGHLQIRPTGMKGAFEDWRQTKIPSFITKIFPDISSPRDFSKNWPVHKLSSENYPTYGDIGLEFPIKATPKGVDSWFTGEASGREIPASIQQTRRRLPKTYIHENFHGGMIKAFDLGLKNIDKRLRNAKGEEKEKLRQDKKWLKSYVKRYGEDAFHTPIYALTHLITDDWVEAMNFLQYDRHPMAKEIAQNIEKAIDRRFQEVTEKVDPGKTWPMKNYRTTRIDLLTGKPARSTDFLEMVRNLSIVHAQLIVNDLEKAQDKLMPYIPAKYLKDTPFARTENERVPKAKDSLLNGL